MEIISFILNNLVVIASLVVAAVTAIATIALAIFNRRYIKIHEKYVQLIERDRVAKKIQEIYTDVISVMINTISDSRNALEEKTYFKIFFDDDIDRDRHQYKIQIFEKVSLEDRLLNNRTVQIHFSFKEEHLEKNLETIAKHIRQCDEVASEIKNLIQIPFEEIPQTFKLHSEQIWKSKRPDKDFDDFKLYRLFIYSIAGSIRSLRMDSEIDFLRFSLEPLKEQLLLEKDTLQIINQIETKRIEFYKNVDDFYNFLNNLIVELSNAYQINLNIKPPNYRGSI